MFVSWAPPRVESWSCDAAESNWQEIRLQVCFILIKILFLDIKIVDWLVLICSVECHALLAAGSDFFKIFLFLMPMLTAVLTV